MGIFTCYGGGLTCGPSLAAGLCTNFSWLIYRLQLLWFAIDNGPIVVFCLLGYSWPFSADELQINWFTNYPLQPTPGLIYAWQLLSFFFSFRLQITLLAADLFLFFFFFFLLLAADMFTACHFLSLASDMFMTGHFFLSLAADLNRDVKKWFFLPVFYYLLRKRLPFFLIAHI